MNRDDDEKTKDLFRRRREEQRAREFSQMARRLEKEREAGRALVEQLLREPRDRWPSFAEQHDLATAGALEQLGNTVARVVTKDPITALAIAELAVAVSERVDADAYPRSVSPQLRAHAWKDLGMTLRYLARNDEALEAFDTAEAAIEDYGALAYDRALVRFHRAASLQELGRFDESRALLAECKQVFDDHGDLRHVIRCGLAEGALLHRLRMFREARESYLLLFASAKSMDDETRAALHRVIGLCSIELNDFREAELNLTHAIALHGKLGQPLELIKSQRCLGVLFIRRGEIGRGVDYLRGIRREFLRAGLAEEAGLCGLDIVEGLLALGHATRAETLARKIVREFTAAGLSARAINALGYLSEAITAHRASAKLVAEVRDYIVSLRTEPERDFATSS